MGLQDMCGKISILSPVGLIENGKDQIKTGDKGRWHVDLLMHGDKLVEPSEFRVSRGKHGTAGLQGGADPRLGNGNLLLLHCLMKGTSILIRHLIYLINTGNTHICKNKGTGLQGPLSLPKFIPDCCGGETRCSGCLARGVDASRC